MNENPLISVIVPIYKVESYLDKCITSIINQTYHNLQIILIDDGSPDNCPTLCDNWKKKDDRITVIHQSNGGLSHARNSGLNIAKGEYICFIDSDDYVSNVMIEELYKALIDNNAEIAECDYIKFTDDRIIDCQKINNELYQLFKCEDALFELFQEKAFKHVVWNKLYKRDVLSNLQFENGKIHEDLFFTYQVFGKCMNIVKLNETLYFYRQRDDSIMGIQYSVKNLDALEARENQFFFVKKNYPKLSNIVQNNYLGNSIYFGQLALSTNNKDIIFETFKKISPKYKYIYHQLKINTSFKYKIWYYFGLISLKNCCRLRNKFKIGL